MTERIKIGEVEIDVTFKDIKNLHLSVHPPMGKVTISSPEIYDLEKVRIYAATKLPWIKKEQRKFREQTRESKRLYKNQESHYFFGDRYLLKLAQSSRNKVEVNGKKLIIYSVNPIDSKLSEKTLYAFYRKALRKYLNKHIQHFSAQMQVEVPAFKIRTMKTKWGSCNTDGHQIWFNLELAKKPFDCIDYVVVHELVHLLERNHNKRFVLLMDQYYPNWRTQKKVLNELPLSFREN